MPPILFSTLVQHFLAHVRLTCRPSTLRSYRESLAALSRSFGAHLRASRLSTAEVDAFVSSQLAQGLARGGINVRLRVLKATLRFGVREHYLPALPVTIKLLRVTASRHHQPITGDGVAQLLAAAKPRERALVAVLAAGGLRINEALHLRWSDLDGDRLWITAKPDVGWEPKSHQEREVYLEPAALAALGAYRATQRWNTSDEAWMFQKHSGRRLQTATRSMRMLFERTGLYKKGKVCHELRRGAASAWLVNGIDLNTVRELLGHGSIITTQLYVTSNEDAKRAASKRGLMSRRGGSTKPPEQ